jgi:hypothetical protein
MGGKSSKESSRDLGVYDVNDEEDTSRDCCGCFAKTVSTYFRRRLERVLLPASAAIYGLLESTNVYFISARAITYICV